MNRTLPACLQFHQGIDGAILLQGLLRRRDVELHQVEIVGLHPHQALLHAGDDVVAREDVRADLADRGRRCTHQATAFAREVVLGSPMRDVASDALLAHAVVDRGIDVVDAGIEHGVEDGFGLLFGRRARPRGTAQFHRAVAKHGDMQSRAPEFPLRQIGHDFPPRALPGFWRLRRRLRVMLYRIRRGGRPQFDRTVGGGAGWGRERDRSSRGWGCGNCSCQARNSFSVDLRGGCGVWGEGRLSTTEAQRHGVSRRVRLYLSVTFSVPLCLCGSPLLTAFGGHSGAGSNANNRRNAGAARRPQSGLVSAAIHLRLRDGRPALSDRGRRGSLRRNSQGERSRRAARDFGVPWTSGHHFRNACSALPESFAPDV